METKKTDNHNLPAKLALRRYFLRKYHARGQAEAKASRRTESSASARFSSWYFARAESSARPTIHVLDCCQASGRIWSVLQNEFPVASYWGVDLKPKKGRLAIDSVKILDQPGWTQNVVDVDTYDSPWKHWFALLRNCRHDVTVFLTIGMVKVGGGNYDRALLASAGITFERLEIPNSLGARVSDLIIKHALTAESKHGLRPVEVLEAPNPGNARYFGVRLERV